MVYWVSTVIVSPCPFPVEKEFPHQVKIKKTATYILHGGGGGGVVFLFFLPY